MIIYKIQVFMQIQFRVARIDICCRRCSDGVRAAPEATSLVRWSYCFVLLFISELESGHTTLLLHGHTVLSIYLGKSFHAVAASRLPDEDRSG